jgi:aminopeptidase N
MVRFFGERFGVKYPWNKYAQAVVSDFVFGGMENTTATTLYEHVLLDERAAIDVTSDDLIAHELAHQWFGDLVTCRDWSEGWLNEGFATFMEHVWRQNLLGDDEYFHGLKNDLAAYLGEARGRYRRPVVCRDYDAPLDLFDRHLYEKGGLVLHLLRVELGDEIFWTAVRTYLSRYAKTVVETTDLQRVFEEVSGKSLGRIFDQWLYKPGHPEVEVHVAWEDGVLSVTSKQTHHATDSVPNAFSFPLVMRIADERGERDEELSVTERTHSFAISCKSRPTYVVVDPDFRVLGDVSVEMPKTMLHAQLEKASTARARSLAAEALAKTSDLVTVRTLAACVLAATEFWGVRSKAAETLGKIRSSEAEDALLAACTVTHPKVRRAVASALSNFRTSRTYEALKQRLLSDESYLVAAEAARAIGHTRHEGARDVLVDATHRASWAEVVACGAIGGLAELRDDAALPHVTARTRYGHPTRLRREAILALPKMSQSRSVRETLEDLLTDRDPHLRIDVARALLDLGDARSRTALAAQLEREKDARVRRRIREVLRDLADAKRRGHDARNEVEKLEHEVAELKARLARLEAKMEPVAEEPKTIPVEAMPTTTTRPETPRRKPKKRLKKKS